MPPKKAKKRSSKKRPSKKQPKYAFLLAKIADPTTAPSWFPSGELLIRWDHNGVAGYEEWNGVLAGKAYNEFKSEKGKLPESALNLQSLNRRTRDAAFAKLESILDGFAEIAPTGLDFKYTLLVYEANLIYRVKLEVITEVLHRIVDLIEEEKV